MRNTFTEKKVVLAAACALALGVFSATASAQDVNEKALLLDTRGAPVMSGTGLCWHSAYDPAPSWTAGCHAAVPAPVSQYVAPVAQPVKAAAPVPIYEKVVLDTNILFDSDKSGLRPTGRAKLDELVRKTSGLESESMMAIGYADRMGTESSNQILSEDRVKTVKAYLVSKGIAANRVQSKAWGETHPTTYATECADANNAKNVACMQPDRHVFIEVSGARLVK